MPKPSIDVYFTAEEAVIVADALRAKKMFRNQPAGRRTLLERLAQRIDTRRLMLAAEQAKQRA